MSPNNTPAAPGWYPDPRPRHGSLLAWWDGHQWHLGATKLTEPAEWIAVGVGVLAAIVVGAIFPPALVLIFGVWMWWYLHDKNKKRTAAAQAQWYQQHGK